MQNQIIRYFFVAFFLIKPNFLYSEPWFSVDNQIVQLEIEQLRLCGVEVPANSAFPLNISIVHFAIENSNQIDSSEVCQKILYAFKSELEKKLYNTKNIIGFQSKRPDIYFQDFQKRLLNDSTIYMSSTKSGQNYAYNLSLQVLPNEHRFDESYLSFYSNNHVFTLGRISKWWSPSFNSSLILSNSARPSPGISFSNYKPAAINNKYLSFLGPISYEFFLNKLESERHVPNALLFGNRISIQPSRRLNISLFRTAQLGGEGRTLNSKIFFDMLIGKDNYLSTDANKENEPGNQLGGLDFNYLFLKNKNLSFYGQIVGEDESGYLPSKTFYSIGITFLWDRLNQKKINFEYIDTGSRQINTTYNHSIYKNGYKYYGMPIGSAFDADSKVSIFNYQQVFRRSNNISFRVIKASLNYNKNDNFFINGLSDDLDIVEIKFGHRLLERTYLNLTIQYSNFMNVNTYDNLSAHAIIEYKW